MSKLYTLSTHVLCMDYRLMSLFTRVSIASGRDVRHIIIWAPAGVRNEHKYQKDSLA